MEFNIVIIIFMALTRIGVQTQTLYPKSQFLLRPASGLINFIKIPDNIVGLTTVCKLQIPADPIPIIINLNEFVHQSYKLESGEQIQKISSDLCGVRMYPISEKMDETNLNLVMEFKNETSISIPFSIFIFETIENISPVNISHAFTNYYYLPYEAKYYEYENEFGDKLKRNNIQFYDIGVNSETWIGRGLVDYQMDEIKTVYNLIEDYSDPDAESFLKFTKIESSQSNIYRCDADLKSSQYSGICFARKPDGTLIKIESGLLTNRYSAYDTQHLKGICSLEILKPFDASDKGIWQILFPGYSSGCIFSVDGENEKKNRIENILATADSPIQLDVDVTKPGQTVTIMCEYPDQIEFCILHNPNGNFEIKDNQNSPNTIVLGYCSYDIEPINGKWACSIKPRESEHLITINYQINTYNASYLTMNSTSEKRFDAESIEVMCQTRFNYKLEYCFYESPGGVWYSLTEKNRNEINRISYVGRGLRYGDCGISITNIQQEDFGNWTCYVKLHSSAPIQYTHMEFLLVEDEIVGSAIIIGLSVAFGIILLALALRYTYTRYRNRRNHNSTNIEFQ